MESIRILITYGAKYNVHVKDKIGLTSLHYAVGIPDLLEILIQLGADVSIAEEGTRSFNHCFTYFVTGLMVPLTLSLMTNHTNLVNHGIGICSRRALKFS